MGDETRHRPAQGIRHTDDIQPSRSAGQPAGAANQLIGVFAKTLGGTLGSGTEKIGSGHVLVVHADDGLDEISIATPTFVQSLIMAKFALIVSVPGNSAFNAHH